MRPTWAPLLALLLLSGCASSGTHKATSSPSNDQLGLQATDTTGILRGVAFDAAIRPLANVTIALTGSQTNRSTTSNPQGQFGFQDLTPGTYFVQASKPGYVAVQQSADVVAGQADPPVVKLMLAPDNTTAPHETTYTFDGFIQCSGSFVAVGFAACSAAGTGSDNTQTDYAPETVPDWAQSEMTWQSTQAASPNLNLDWSRAVPNQTLLDNWAQESGPSPLLLQADRAKIDEVHLGSTLDCTTAGPAGCLYLRVFNAPIDGTNPTCVPRPVLGGCTTGLGVTINQKFTIVTNLFYGYAPPTAWRYADTGPYPPPG